MFSDHFSRKKGGEGERTLQKFNKECLNVSCFLLLLSRSLRHGFVIHHEQWKLNCILREQFKLHPLLSVSGWREEGKVYSLFRPPFHYQSAKQRRKLSALPFFNFPLGWAFFCRSIFRLDTLRRWLLPDVITVDRKMTLQIAQRSAGGCKDCLSSSPELSLGADWNIKLVFVFITSLSPCLPSKVPSNVIESNLSIVLEWIAKNASRESKIEKEDSTIKRLGEINSIGILINFSSLIGKLLFELDDSRFTCKSI